MTDPSVTLREYMERLVASLESNMDRRFEALERDMERRLDARDRAVVVHEDMLKDRLFHSNGLIEQMRAQAADYARISSMEAAEDRIEALEQQRSRDEGRVKGAQPMSALVMLIVAAVVSAVVGFVASKI